MQRTVIFLAESFPNPISTFLSEHGFNVMEALSVSEVLHLTEYHPIDALVIAPPGEWYGLEDIQQKRVTLNLAIHATAAEVLFELSNLLGNGSQQIQ